MELGGVAASGTVELPTIQREDVKSTVQVQVLGAVAVKLGNGFAAVDIDHTGWGEIFDGTLGATDSTWFWNKDRDKFVNAHYYPCFGMNTEKDMQLPEGASQKGEYDPPTSKIGYYIKMLPDGKVDVTIRPGPMQACFITVPHTVEKGGLENNQLWSDNNGGFIKTNKDSFAVATTQQIVSAHLDSLIIKVVEAQACPAEAMRNGGVSDAAVRDAVGNAALGSILKKSKNDPALYEAIQKAYDEGRYRVELSKDSERQPAAIAELNKMVADLKGKNLADGLKDNNNSPYNFTISISDIEVPKTQTCGSGTIGGGK
jgi:hypothetical protein